MPSSIWTAGDEEDQQGFSGILWGARECASVCDMLNSEM